MSDDPAHGYAEVHGEGGPLVLLHGAYTIVDDMGPILTAPAGSRWARSSPEPSRRTDRAASRKDDPTARSSSASRQGTEEQEESEPMKKHVLFVHGAGEGAHEEDRTLAESLQNALGAGYDVRSPQMPNEDSPEYGAWRDRISEELAGMNGAAVLVGHSFGASVLLKYLSEEGPERPVAGVFLVAAPFWGAEEWDADEYALREDCASRLPGGLPIFFYHGRDDEVVPFAHLALYAERLPRATFREFDGRGHQFDDDLSEVAGDIKASTIQEEAS